jgi:BspA type Leucine rich repeat region (6 copies)
VSIQLTPMTKKILFLLAAVGLVGSASAQTAYFDFSYDNDSFTASIRRFYPTSYIGSVDIPGEAAGGYTGSGTFWGAFSDCTGLTSVSIPNSVTRIEYGTFSGCSGLTSISIPNSVTSIGACAFSDCTGLTSISIPNSVTRIEVGAFHGCTGISGISIPNSVTSIGPDNGLLFIGGSGTFAAFNNTALINFGFSPQEAVLFGAQYSKELVALVRARLLEDSSFAAAIALQIKSDPNNYGLAVKQNQSLNFPSIPTLIITPGKKYTNVVTASSGLTPVIQTCGNTAIATISNNVLTLIGSGTTTITASQAGNYTWNPISSSQPLIVNKGVQTMNFPAIPAQTYSTSKTLTLNATTSAKLTPITYSSGNTAVAIVSNNILLLQGKGTSLITASQAGNAFFNSTTGSQTLTVK